jgi:hypothetical protein
VRINASASTRVGNDLKQALAKPWTYIFGSFSRNSTNTSVKKQEENRMRMHFQYVLNAYKEA